MSLRSAIVKNSAETEMSMLRSVEQVERKAAEFNKENAESATKLKECENKNFSINEAAVELQCINASNCIIGSKVNIIGDHKETSELNLNGLEDNDHVRNYNTNKHKELLEEESHEEEELTFLSERAKMWEALLPYDKSEMLSKSEESESLSLSLSLSLSSSLPPTKSEQSTHNTMEHQTESFHVIHEPTCNEEAKRNISKKSVEEPTLTKQSVSNKNMASESINKLKDLTNIYVDRDQLYSLEKSPSPSPSPFPISSTGNSVFSLTTRSRNIFASLHRSQSWNKENKVQKIDCHVRTTNREEEKDTKKSCASNEIKYKKTAFNKAVEHLARPPTEPFDVPFTSLKEMSTNTDWNWREQLSVSSVNPLCHKLHETRQILSSNNKVMAKSMNENCYNTCGEAHVYSSNNNNNNNTKEERNNIYSCIDDDDNNSIIANDNNNNDNDDGDDTVKRKKLEDIIAYTTNDYAKHCIANTNSTNKKLSIPSSNVCNEMNVCGANKWHCSDNRERSNSIENTIDIDNIKNDMNSINRCPVQRVSKQHEKPKIKMITVSMEEMNRLKSEVNKYRTLYLCERNLIEEKNSNYNELYCNYQQKILENISLKSRGEENKRFIRQLKREIGMSRTHVMEVSNKSLLEKRSYNKQIDLYEERIAELAQIREEENEENALKVQALEQLVKDLSCLRLHEQMTLGQAELNSNEQLEEALAQNESLQALLKASYAKNTILFDDIVRQAEQLQLLETKCKQMHAANSTTNDVSINDNVCSNNISATNKKIKTEIANYNDYINNSCKEEQLSKMQKARERELPEQLEDEQKQQVLFADCNESETAKNNEANISTTSEQLIKEMQSINAIICEVNTCVNRKKNVDADNIERYHSGNVLESSEAAHMQSSEVGTLEMFNEGQETEQEQQQEEQLEEGMDRGKCSNLLEQLLF